ncbi:helix-turn-helix domain-containing protein [Sulfurimonas sp. SAG-AH-194-C21]|nr:helix-turn-helix domain-containing protein [Sulfurimonas sp. SAG-AH-194-C21]MDF1882743.1 helix-turn-helix domain-containing protein [Sulfurimonas sp. SAG-AH-194-C21]
MEITVEIIKKLKELKNSNCKKERIHSHALLLLNNGRDIKEVAEIFDVTDRSIYKWIKAFKSEGISSVSRKSGAGRKAILNTNSDKSIIEEQISLYPHQPKKAYAMSLEKLSSKMSYKTFQRFLKKHLISATSE